jgi:hypothetical protein
MVSTVTCSSLNSRDSKHRNHRTRYAYSDIKRVNKERKILRRENGMASTSGGTSHRCKRANNTGSNLRNNESNIVCTLIYMGVCWAPVAEAAALNNQQITVSVSDTKSTKEAKG